jgi:flagellar basal-body rod modification protein FlgD
MTTVNPPTAIDQILSSVNQTRTTTGTTQTTQDRFLKLLITQMQNQDPLNPMDNAEVTSQLAQISTVSGIEKLNTTIASMTSSMVAAQSLQAGSLIGHAVLAPGKTVLLQHGNAVGGVQLSEPADQVTITIADAAGLTIKTLSSSGAGHGTHNFGWDGTTDAGEGR